MGLFDEFGKALKRVEAGVKKGDPDNRAGKEISGKAGGNESPGQPAGKSRQPHPGYAKIAAWMKTKYKDRIGGTSEYQRGLQLEQLSAEASAGLSAKARKGFLEYLKKQNYEPLLK